MGDDYQVSFRRIVRGFLCDLGRMLVLMALFAAAFILLSLAVHGHVNWGF